jgi:hypothetical protein
MSVDECRVCGLNSPWVGHSCRDESDRLRAENARLKEGLKITLTYGLPPDDISGREAWNRACAAALEGK